MYQQQSMQTYAIQCQVTSNNVTKSNLEGILVWIFYKPSLMKRFGKKMGDDSPPHQQHGANSTSKVHPWPKREANAPLPQFRGMVLTTLTPSLDEFGDSAEADKPTERLYSWCGCFGYYLLAKRGGTKNSQPLHYIGQVKIRETFPRNKKNK